MIALAGFDKKAIGDVCYASAAARGEALVDARLRRKGSADDRKESSSSRQRPHQPVGFQNCVAPSELRCYAPGEPSGRLLIPSGRLLIFADKSGKGTRLKQDEPARPDPPPLVAIRVHPGAHSRYTEGVALTAMPQPPCYLAACYRDSGVTDRVYRSIGSRAVVPAQP